MSTHPGPEQHYVEHQVRGERQKARWDHRVKHHLQPGLSNYSRTQEIFSCAIEAWQPSRLQQLNLANPKYMRCLPALQVQPVYGKFSWQPKATAYSMLTTRILIIWFWLLQFYLSGVGKTTLIRKVCSELQKHSIVLRGFYTEEVREGGREGGRGRGRGPRVGFDVVTLDGKRGPLARVGRWGFYEDCIVFCINTCPSSRSLPTRPKMHHHSVIK